MEPHWLLERGRNVLEGPRCADGSLFGSSCVVLQQRWHRQRRRHKCGLWGGNGQSTTEPGLGSCCIPSGRGLSLSRAGLSVSWLYSAFRLERQQQLQPTAQLFHSGFCSRRHLLFLVATEGTCSEHLWHQLQSGRSCRLLRWSDTERGCQKEGKMEPCCSVLP